MRYLGIDVHSQASVWCLLDQDGEIVREGKTPTTVAGLKELATKLKSEGPVRAGQEVGTMAYLVHDAFTVMGVEILSFNAAQLRMIAASRKKTDRRDAYWIARGLATGMHPHPVYIPTGEIRELRTLLTRRRLVLVDHNRWQHRARSGLRASGVQLTRGGYHLTRRLAPVLETTSEIDPQLRSTLELCQRQQAALSLELRQVEAEIRSRIRSIDAIARLQTIPGIGVLTATTIYAWIGDVHRFPSAKVLSAYAGLVPSVRQSGASQRMGPITKTGAKPLRGALVQAATVVMYRSAAATPNRCKLWPNVCVDGVGGARLRWWHSHAICCASPTTC